MGDQPSEHLAGAIGHIAGQVIGFEGKALFYPFDHGLGRVDLLGDARRRASTSRMTACSMSIG